MYIYENDRKLTKTKKRKFSISDLAIIVACLAVGIRWSFLSETTPDQTQQPSDKFLIIRPIIARAVQFSYMTLPMATMLTCGLLLVRIRFPRPPIRQAFTDPGFTPVLTILAIFALVVLPTFFLKYIGMSPFGYLGTQLFHIPDMITNYNSVYVGPTVAIHWLYLGVSGNWRSNRDWIDAVGRIVGVYYLVLVPLQVWYG